MPAPNWALNRIWRTAPSSAEKKKDDIKTKLASAMVSSRVRMPRSCRRGKRSAKRPPRGRTTFSTSRTSDAWATPIHALSAMAAKPLSINSGLLRFSVPATVAASSLSSLARP